MTGLPRYRVLGALVATLVAAGADAQEPRPVALDTLRVDVASRASSLVSATRAVDVVDVAAIRRIPARTVSDVLAWVLGVDVLARSPAQADVALRGSTFEQVLVLVDGVRMNDPQTGHFALNLAIPLEEIERIEILRGPGSSLYGSDAVGGVIQIVTRRGHPEQPRIEASLEGGAFGTAGASVVSGAPVGALSSRIAAEARRSDGHRPGTDSRTLMIRSALEGQVAGGPLHADLGLALRDFGARHFYTSPDAPFDEYERTRAATASLGWRTPPGSGWSLEPRLSMRRHSDEFLLERDDPAFYRNVHTSWQLGGEVVARTALREGVVVAVGAEAFRDRLQSTNLGDPVETRAAGYAELAAGLDHTAIVHFGIRGDHHSTFGAFATPSLAAALWPASGVKLRASGARSFRAPNWTERFYSDPANEGDPDLRPETAWTGEVGIEIGEPARRASIGVAGFVRAARSVIDWARPAGGDGVVWQALNIGRATFRGIEVDARALDAAGTRWVAQLSLLGFSSGEDGWESKYALRPLTRTASITATRSFLGTDVSIRGLHARRVEESTYTTADARLSRAIGGRFRIDVDITNLADVSFLDVTGLPAPGRAAFVRLSWR